LAIRRDIGFVAISETTKRALTDRFPVDSRRVSVAHPGCEPRFSPTPVPGEDEVLSRLGVRRPYALATGTVEPRKNLPRLIEAFGSLEPELREGWTLVLVGAPGWATEASFAAAARHRGVASTLGFVSDEELACLYRQADLFCYVSLQEGFGLPVLEAMQSGTAVLTSSVSSMPEVGGEAVCYADPCDVVDIRRGLRDLLGDPELRARLAASGIERARAFDWQHSAGRVVRFLEDRAR
jgi:glycosyltransferase involved in cell wall biosynthesis